MQIAAESAETTGLFIVRISAISVPCLPSVKREHLVKVIVVFRNDSPAALDEFVGVSRSDCSVVGREKHDLPILPCEL